MTTPLGLTDPVLSGSRVQRAHPQTGDKGEACPGLTGATISGWSAAFGDSALAPVPGPDGHVTRYGLEWLVRNSYEGQKQQVMHPRILWNAEIYRQAQVPSVDCRSFLETDEGLKEFLQNFLLYGIAFVENVTPTKEDTEILAERISIIRYLGYPGKGGLVFFLFGKLLPPYLVFCVAQPGLQTSALGLVQPLAAPLDLGWRIPLWDLLYGTAGSHSVTELPRSIQ